jgi:diadenosine tetraphosphate (Ap4A) HIT family hydrolase
MICEFCEELSGRSSRIEKIYGAGFRRIVRSYGEVVVMPTIGQLFLGSMLIVPREHVETIADANARVQEEVEEALIDIQGRLQHLGRVVLFEHGAKRSTSSGCGVYHAHLHVVPVPAHIASKEFLPTAVAESGASLRGAWKALQHSSNYFICQDTHGRLAYVEGSADPGAPWLQSQFGRRQLVRFFGLNADWDWKRYSIPESNLLSSLQLFGTSHVSVSQGN